VALEILGRGARGHHDDAIPCGEWWPLAGQRGQGCSFADRCPPEEAVRVLNRYLHLQADLVKRFRGDVDKFMGDAVFAHFGGADMALDAIRCAVEIQDALKTRNESLHETQRMLFRVGINLGEVTATTDDRSILSAVLDLRYGVTSRLEVEARLPFTYSDDRATFLVHPEDSQAKFSFAIDENAHQVQPERPIVPLKNAIRVLNGFGRSLEVILPKLRDGYIVPDPAFARELALENPDAFFLSQSGECFHNVTVTGGKQRTEGPLSMKRELRDLLRHMGELEQALRNQETRVLNLSREIKDLTSLLERLEADKRESEKQVMTSLTTPIPGKIMMYTAGWE